MYEVDYRAMGQRIRVRRREIGLTQEKLAEKVDVSLSHIGEIERGTTICSVAVLTNISIILNLNLDFLVKGINSENANNVLTEVLDAVPSDNKKLYVEICETIADKLK